MRKKRFDYEECYLKFNGEIFAIAEGKKNAKVIGETLIQLSDENEQLLNANKELKFEIKNLRAVLMNIYGIAKENGVITRLRLYVEFEEYINNKWWKNG